jgi:hypothetical protein
MTPRQPKPAIEYAGDLGWAAAQLHAHGDRAADDALALLWQVNPRVFGWLTERLLAVRDAGATELIDRMCRRGDRAGVCRIYFLDEDVTCPLCGADVPRRTLHECAVGEAPNTSEVRE